MAQELQGIGNICVNTGHVKIASLAKILCHQFINGKRLALYSLSVLPLRISPVTSMIQL